MADRDVTFDLVARDKTSSGIQSVERNLKRVSKQSDVLNRQFKDMGKGNVATQMVQGVLKSAGSLTRAIGKSFSSAVSASGPLIQSAVGVALIAAATGGSAAMASAMVGGAGLGGVVGGVLLASKDARVNAAFTSLGRYATDRLQDAAQSFVPATVKAVNTARSAFGRMLPNLRRVFEKSSTWVEPLTRSLGRAAELALSGITKAVTKADPIIRVIGQGIEMIGKSVGKFFGDLSDNGDTLAFVLKNVFIVISSSINIAAVAINVLVEAFEFFIDKIPGAKGLLKEYVGSQDEAETGAYNLAGGFKALTGDANDAAYALQNVHEKQQQFADDNISLREAQIGAKDAIKEANKVLKENGEAHGFNSVKGRENERALNDVAEAFNRETTAGEKSGITAAEASDKYHTNRQALIKMAEKAGYSKTEAEKLASALLKIPKNVKTDIDANTAGALEKLTTFQKKVNSLTGKTVTVRVTSSGDHYTPGVGTNTKFASAASFIDGTGGTHRTGGATPVNVNLTSQLVWDGKVLAEVIDRRIDAAQQRQATRSKVGRR